MNRPPRDKYGMTPKQRDYWLWLGLIGRWGVRWRLLRMTSTLAGLAFLVGVSAGIGMQKHAEPYGEIVGPDGWSNTACPTNIRTPVYRENDKVERGDELITAITQNGRTTCFMKMVK